MKGGEVREVSSSSPPLWSSALWASSLSFVRRSPAHASSSAASWRSRSSAAYRFPDVAVQCYSPTVVGNHVFPCGKCVCCRADRRAVWVCRILLEAGLWPSSVFVTLTYSEDRVREELCPSDLVLWFKRLRKLQHKLGGAAPLRYFACGEYGDRTRRPHYHAILFNYPACLAPIGTAPGQLKGCPCSSCVGVRMTWGAGHVLVGSVTEASARYMSKYVMKGWTSDRPELEGREPEFFRVSRLPGLGAGAMAGVAETLRPLLLHLPSDWVPRLVRIAGKKRPIGRYLRALLAKEMGRELPSLDSYQSEELQNVRAYAWDNEYSVKEVFQKVRGDEPGYTSRGEL